jgi:Cdc6-like AAA superfamily ATPase
MGDVVDRVRKVCAKYKQLTTSAAAASKSNTFPLSGDGVAERLEPASEQQQLQLQDAVKKLTSVARKELLPLRVHELTAVQRVVTEAISGNTGTSVHVHGPRGSGKSAALLWHLPRAVSEWCKEHAKPVPISIDVFLSYIKHSAGLYREVLEQLKQQGLPVDEVSEVAAEAKKQLEAVVFNTNHSSSSSGVSKIMLTLNSLDHMTASHTDQLQQLYDLAHTPGSRLILLSAGRHDVTQTLPGLQKAGIVPVQVRFNPFTDNDLVAILSARVGSVVQRHLSCALGTLVAMQSVLSSDAALHCGTLTTTAPTLAKRLH